MVEAPAIDERQEQKGGMIRDLLDQLQKRREEDDEARLLIEEMQRNLDEAQNRSYEVELKLDRVLWEYIEALDKVMTKLWQMMRSRDAKNLNLDEDFEDMSKAKQIGWNESTKTTGFWRQEEDTDRESLEPEGRQSTVGVEQLVRGHRCAKSLQENETRQLYSEV